MENYLFDRKHLIEYASYGIVAGTLYGCAVWYVLYQSHPENLHVLYVGCFLFMFTILLFSLRLNGQVPENKSTWTMIIEAHLAVAAGIITALVLSGLFWTVYKPQSITGTSPAAYDSGQWNALRMILLTATMGNFGGAAFISAIAAYAIKPDQTKDQTPAIFEDNPKPDEF